MEKSLYKSILLATSAVSAGFAAPAVVAQEGTGLQLEEIVVTARRREERLQDVPISMTVLDQQALNDAFITNASDIATYTPSLFANDRFGSDSSTFAIRGFSQELRTTSSVGVYFAEVVAPRGANTTQSGDGAGPGAFFDLENVQVLKGPQGTLFGRNTTGGAVMLTPRKPTEEFEGYAEVSVGNYDMHRLQGVVNIPLADDFRVRLGVNHQKRDGYLNNISDIGPDDFADEDFTTVRASAVWDITDNLENYTILRWTESDNNATPYSLFACNPAGSLGGFCQADLNQRRANGNDGFYDVYNFEPDSKSELERKQVINTTTWTVSDNLTIKNIFSYAEFESRQNFALYGTNWQLPILDPQTFQPVGSQHVIFQAVGSTDFQPTTNQDTLVEELQFQGTAFDERLTWQAGLYYEKSEPDGDYGSQNPSIIACDPSTTDSANPADFRCNNLLVAFGAFQGSGGQVPQVPAMRQGGSMLVAPGGVEYENKAVYAQGTWEFSPEWSATVGLRYTDDETEGETNESVYYFPGSVFGGFFPPDPSLTSTQRRTPSTSSEEPTWTIGVDYTPSQDMLLYGKYSRGYRQGSVNLASIPEWHTHGPEQVDTYEIGAKTAFEGRFPGTFNIAAFYNDFQDQQVQFGYLRDNGVGTTSILNAGESTIWGVEMDGNIRLTDNLNLTASYAYLDTEVEKLDLPQPPYPDGVGVFSGTTTAEGEPLSFAPEHSLVLGANYRLPVDPQLGDMVASATYVYNDEMQAVSEDTSPLAILSSYELVNFNFNWNSIAGGPMDMALFVTNAFDEEYETHLTGNWVSGLEIGRVGKPRMYGMRLKYNF